MSNRFLIPGIILALILIALSFPQLAGILFLNLANTEIARAVSHPPDSPGRAALLAEADLHLDRAQSFSYPSRIALAKARAALARNDAIYALDIFNVSGTTLQNDSVAQFTWANAAWLANQPDVAFTHWRAAESLEYFRQQMHRAMQSHEWREAENSARIAVGIDSGFADGHYVLGDALSHQNVNNPEALHEVDIAKGLTQDNGLVAAILSRKGEILSSQNKFRDAIAVFNEARGIAPIDARPRTGYADATFKLDPRSRDQSIALLKQVVSDSPWYIPAYISLSSIFESIAQTNETQTWLETGLQKNPNDSTLLFALGQFYTRQKRFAEARATLVAAMKYETHADSLETIASALAELPPQ